MFTRSISFIILSAISTLSGFILFPLFIEYLNPVEFGFYSLIVSLMTLSSLISGLGLYNGMSNFYFDMEREKRKEFVDILYSSSLMVNLALSFVLILIFFMFTSYDFELKLIFCLAILLGFTDSMNSLYFQYLRNSGRDRAYISLSAISIILGLVITTALLTSGYGLWSVVVGKLIVSGTLLSGIVILKIKFQLNTAYIQPVFKYGLKMIPVLILTWVFQYADRFIAEVFLPPLEFGTFGFVVSAAGLIMTGFLAIGNSIQPELYSSFKEGVVGRTVKLVNHYQILMLSAAAMGFLTLVLIHFYWTSFEYHDNLGSLSLFFGGFFLLSIQHLFNMELMFSKKVRKLTFLQNLSYASYSIVLAILFYYGVKGVSVAAQVFFYSRILVIIYYSIDQKNARIMKYGKMNISKGALIIIALSLVTFKVLS